MPCGWLLPVAGAEDPGTDLWACWGEVAQPQRAGQPGYDQPGFIHWDTDISRYPNIPFRLQGVLALEDTSADMGGFQCVPSIYRDQQRFLDEQAKAGPVSRAPDIGGHPIVKVPLAAGDLVIWKTTLLHGNGRNSSRRPRLAQYLTMNPLPRPEKSVRWSAAASCRGLSVRPQMAMPFPVTRAASRSSEVSRRHSAPWAGVCWDLTIGLMLLARADR